MIDLNPNHLETVRRILAEHVPAYEVRAFGSRATWTAKDYSDIDLAIVGPGTVGWEALSRLKEAFEESDLPIRVDVLDWHATSESFREVIERDYVVVQNQASADGTGLPGEWRMCSLGELADNFDSIRIPVKQRDRRPGPYPYYGASGVVDYVDGFLFDGEYLLIAEDGENLRTRTTPIAFVANGKFWVNNHAHIVRGNSNGDTRFLKYVLSGLNISGYLTGSTMPKLTQGNMKRISFLAPPLPEQRAIAHVLGTLDDKIELNRRMNRTLEEMARALFKSWFVDFDPVRAKATLKHHDAHHSPLEGDAILRGLHRQGKGIARRRAGGGSDWTVERTRSYLDRMDPNIAALFPDSFVDSELGPIPAGWEVGCFGDVVEQIRDRENPLASPDAIFHHFSIPAFDENQCPMAERGENIKSQKSRVLPGVVLLSKLNPEIERVWMVDVGASDRAVCSTEFLVLRPRPPYGRSFAYCLGCSPAFRQELGSLVTGTSKSHQRVQADAVFTLPVVLFPKPISEAFERKLSVVLQMTQASRRESRTLATLRDALLPKLVSGEVRVERV